MLYPKKKNKLNKISYIFVEILIVLFAFKKILNGSTHFSMRTASLTASLITIVK